MKKILILFALLISVSGYSQKYVQEFNKADGTSIAISLSDVAFAIPSGTANGSVLVLGPNAKTIYVTDSLQGIVDSSGAILVLLEESYKLNGKDALRDIAISKQQVKEVVPSGASQTFVKLASPQKTVLINDDFDAVCAVLCAAISGGDPADGNGIYSGSGTVPKETYAAMPKNDTFNYQDDIEFAIGKFPNYPSIFNNYQEAGIWWNFDLGKGMHFVNSNDYESTITERSYIDVFENLINIGQGQRNRTSSTIRTGDVNTTYQYSHIFSTINAIGTAGANIGNIGSCVKKYDERIAALLGKGGFTSGSATISPQNTDTSLFFRVVYQATGTSSTGRDVFSIRLEDSTSNSVALYSYKYRLPNATPSKTADNKSVMTWTGVGGTSTTPAFTRFSNNIASGTTDGSGDLTITHLLPDATFSATVTVEGTTPYVTTIHTKGATTFKVRFFDSTTGLAASGASVTVNWIAYDY